MRTVREIMEPDVFWLPSDMPLRRAAEELASRQIGGAPACESDGAIVGMVSQTDLTEYYGGAHELRLVRDVMTPEIFSVEPDDPVERAIHAMAFEGVHRLLVLDTDERLMGIITTMDVLRELAGFRRRRPRVLAVAPPERAPESERPRPPARAVQAPPHEAARPTAEVAPPPHEAAPPLRAKPSEARIDAALEGSFPASDPPPWTLGWTSHSPARPRR